LVGTNSCKILFKIFMMKVITFGNYPFKTSTPRPETAALIL